MPQQITLTLSDAHAAKLSAILTAHNAATGATLDLPAWILRHLKEVAIQTDLAQRAQLLEQTKQQELQAAVQTERDTMLTAI